MTPDSVVNNEVVLSPADFKEASEKTAGLLHSYFFSKIPPAQKQLDTEKQGLVILEPESEGVPSGLGKDGR